MAIERVSFNARFLSIRDQVQRAQDDYFKATLAPTTGRKINALSDDPGSLPKIFFLRTQAKANEQYQRNVVGARTQLQTADAALTNSIDTLQTVRDLALRANNAHINTGDRTAITTMIGDLKTRLVSLANTQLEGKYTFSGTAIATQPFSGTPTVFNANDTAVMTQVTSTVQIQTNLDGKELFTGDVATATGASLAIQLKNNTGVGLDVAVGDVITIAGSVGGVAMAGQTLTVSSTTSLTNIASAIQTALRSVADGALTETAVVQANGSIRVTSDAANAITNLTLSISGKSTFNTAFTYPTTIAGGGATGDSDTLKSGVGEDIFDVLDDLSTAITNDSPTDTATHIGRIDNAINQLLDGRAEIGGREVQLNAIESALQDEGLSLTNRLSEIIDADIGTAISDLMKHETVLRTVMSSTTRLLSVILNSGFK